MMSPSTKHPRPVSALQQITTFVLLDLLGSPNPIIRNFYHNTGWLFDQFVSAETRLAEAGHLYEGLSGQDWATKGHTASPGHGPTRSFFQPRSQLSMFNGHIEGLSSLALSSWQLSHCTQTTTCRS